MMADFDLLGIEFARKHPDAFVRVLHDGELAEVIEILAKLPPEVGAAVAARFSPAMLMTLLDSGKVSPERWLAKAAREDAITLIGRIPRDRCLAIVNSVGDRERRRRLLQFLRYPAHSVGSLVTDVPLQFAAGTPANEVIDEVRSTDGIEAGPLVVLRPDGRYQGIVDPWRLIAADTLSGPVGEFASSTPVLHAATSIANAASAIHWQQHDWLPVVDHEDRVLGGLPRQRLFKAANAMSGVPRHGLQALADLLPQLLRVMGQLLDRLLVYRA